MEKIHNFPHSQITQHKMASAAIATPSHKSIISALLKSLTSIPPPLSSSHITEDQQHLLFTLHVLFPNQLLPALDLLDRQLVSKYTEQPSGLAPEGPFDRDRGQQQNLDAATLRTVYLVKSLASTIPSRQLKRRQDEQATDSSKAYLVQLVAWNCSCPSFTIDAFPPTESPVKDEDHDDCSNRDIQLFGGLSLDRALTMNESIPSCKHILACVLGEAWKGTGSVVMEEKPVSKEEMAGILARI